MSRRDWRTGCVVRALTRPGNLRQIDIAIDGGIGDWDPRLRVTLAVEADGCVSVASFACERAERGIVRIAVERGACRTGHFMWKVVEGARLTLTAPAPAGAEGRGAMATAPLARLGCAGVRLR